MVDVRVITTGGTIDKVYFDALSDFAVGESRVGHVLAEAGVTFGWEVTELLRKDSLELTDEDRALVVDAVRSCPETHVLVTHGTDTMAATGQAVERAGLDKTVVLTGAMQPARQRETDAVFNVGFALGVLRTSGPGVWVAMNGQAFRPSRVRKNREANRFEPVDD